MFGDFCNVHDLCYITPDKTQKECDENFYDNMKTKVNCMLYNQLQYVFNLLAKLKLLFR